MFGKLTNMVIECTDLESSRRFYAETLGLTVTADGDGWVCMDAGGTELVLWQGQKHEVVLGFSGAVLEKVRTALEAKGIQTGDLMQHPGGQHYEIRDPDGNKVMIADR